MRNNKILQYKIQIVKINIIKINKIKIYLHCMIHYTIHTVVTLYVLISQNWSCITIIMNPESSCNRTYNSHIDKHIILHTVYYVMN